MRRGADSLARAARAFAFALAFVPAWAPAPARADELGTLFFTPEEREQLDHQRRGDPEAVEAAPRVGAHAITGYVQRSDGRGTVWIDGRPVTVSGPAAARLIEKSPVRPGNRGSGVKLERETPR